MKIHRAALKVIVIGSMPRCCRVYDRACKAYSQFVELLFDRWKPVNAELQCR